MNGPIYLEYDDGHNEPIIRTFTSREEVIAHLNPDGDVTTTGIIDDDLLSDEGGGEWHDGSDKWTRISFSTAEARAQYWQSVADAIRAGEEAP